MAFLEFDFNVMLLQGIENFLDVFKMLLSVTFCSRRILVCIIVT